ncbi:MAG: hypothetical protein U1C74_24075 [Phenylobacterium sp.]|nr:hypothetical protein [Phenylobacterium sp.]
MKSAMRVGMMTVAVMSLAGSAAAATAPLVTYRITPGAMDAKAGQGHVSVEIALPAVDAPAGAPFLSMGTSVPGVSRPSIVTDPEITDASGRVPVTRSDRQGNSEWTPQRAIKGDATVRYRLQVENAPMTQGGPPIAPRIDGRGFSGTGNVLLMTPRIAAPHRVALKWDLSGMAKGSEAVTSFGDGDVELPAGPVDRIEHAIYMAGPLEREPRTGASDGFSSVWLDDPGFDPRPPMQWTGQLHTWMSRFFRDKTVPPYRVFMRFNPMNAGGGAALTNSFLITYGKGVTGESIKSILGHEMAHTWTAGGMPKWYSEGNAVYYQAQLPWRAGMMTTEQYIADVNEHASRYYTNLMRHTPEDQVLAKFWEDTRVRVLPYDRGAMYFAVLNGKIRKASDGKRSVDDLVLTMVERDKAGQTLTEAMWLDLLRQEIGEDGPATHRAMMAGELMLPQSGDFGPCFQRTTHKIRRFDVGFDFTSLVGATKVVTGLKPDSEAAKAGLRNGDHISYSAGLDSVQGDVKRMLTLNVTRDGKTFPITYLPRGEAVDAYQWERLPGVPESACKP